jgi:hypothetical protein
VPVQGQVGTLVELLDDDFVLVEFYDRAGATFSIPTLPICSLLRLSYQQVAARRSRFRSAAIAHWRFFNALNSQAGFHGKHSVEQCYQVRHLRHLANLP